MNRGRLEIALVSESHQKRRIGDVGLVVIDPVSSYLGKVDSRRGAGSGSSMSHHRSTP